MSLLRDHEAGELVKEYIASENVMLFVLSYCDICQRLKEFLNVNEIKYYSIDIDEHPLYTAILPTLNKLSGQKRAPFIYVNKQFLGNYETVLRMYHTGFLIDRVVAKAETNQLLDYDVIVIGGTIEGLAVAIEAGQMGKSVGLFDNIVHTRATSDYMTAVTSGTCSNNGNIPKKLMLQAAMIGELCNDTNFFGWDFEFDKNHNFNWTSLVQNINTHLIRVGERCKNYCDTTKVRILQASVLKFMDSHTVLAEDPQKRNATFTAQVFVIATGGSQKMINFNGAQYAITTEQLMASNIKPGKTLVIGAGPVALEFGGFLNSLGVDVSILVRSKVLTRCDTQISNLLVSHMESRGIKFIYAPGNYEITSPSKSDSPTGFKRKSQDVSSGRQSITISRHKESIHEFMGMKYRLVLNRGKKNGDLLFDTILLAAGRYYSMRGMGIEKLGVKISDNNGKLYVNKYDRTGCPTIFAIGDVALYRPELVSSCIKSGQLLARRMAGLDEVMDHDLIPMTIFTPLEYAFCGLSEDIANEMYGEKYIEIYESDFQPLPWAIKKQNKKICFIKMICLKHDRRVIGLHILGPNASEIIQGFAFAMKLKCTKDDFDKMVGIYPSCAQTLFEIGSMSRAGNRNLTKRDKKPHPW